MRVISRITLLAVILAVHLPPAEAAAATTKTFRDEFTTSSWAQNHGDADWANPWEQIPRADDEIGIKGGNQCVEPKCLKMGAAGLPIAPYGVYRGADLSDAVTATLTFSYKRVLSGAPADAGIHVRVGDSKPAANTIGTIALDASDASHRTFSADISDWLTGSTHIGFLGYGGAVNGSIHIDNVQIVATYGAAPVFTTNIADRADRENDVVSLDADATDADGDPLTYGAMGLPPGVTIDPATGVISGRLTYDAAAGSPYAVSVTVTDGFATDTDAFTWTVRDLNRSPQLQPIGDAAVDEGAPWTLQVSATDPDVAFGDTLSYSLADAPGGMTIGPSSGVIAWTPIEQQGPGAYSVRVRVTDAGDPQRTDTRTFDIDVAEVNEAPTLASVADQTSGVGDRVSLALDGSDPDLPANALAYSATGLPPGLSVSGTRIAGTIGGGDASYSVVVTVADNGSPSRQSSVSFQWIVTTGNRAPVLDYIPDPDLDEDGRVRFTARATDPDGDAVTYSLTGSVPAGAAISSTGGGFVWTPSDAQRGAAYSFTVLASDDGAPRLSDSQQITIDLPPKNLAPIIGAVVDRRSTEGDTVDLTVPAVDGNDPPDALTFTAEGLPAGLTMNPSSGRVTGTISYAAGGGSPYSVTITVTDDGVPARSATVGFQWIVDERNRPPTVSGPTTIVVARGARRTITLEAVDPDGDPVTIALQSTPEYGSATLAGSDFTYLAGQEPGTEELRFVVSDGEFGIVHTVTVSVRFDNTAPEAIDDAYETTVGETLSVPAPGVAGNDDDADGDPLIVSIHEPPRIGELSLAADGSFTYRPPDGFAGRVEFEYAVGDGLATTTAVVRIRVRVLGGIIEPDSREAIVGSTGGHTQSASQQDRALVSRSFVVLARSASVQLDMLSIPLVLLAGLVLAAVTIGRIGTTPLFASRTRVGTLASFDTTQGYGHIVTGDGSEYFVTSSAFRAAVVKIGEQVRFRSISAEPRHLAVSAWKA